MPRRKKQASEAAVRDIRRKTRRRFSAEEKIRIVLDGLRGEGAWRRPQCTSRAIDPGQTPPEQQQLAQGRSVRMVEQRGDRTIAEGRDWGRAGPYYKGRTQSFRVESRSQSW